MPATSKLVADQQDQFVWKIQPAAARWVTRTIDALAARNPVIPKLADQLREFTGTRLVDWVDHFALCDDRFARAYWRTRRCRLSAEQQRDHTVWRHTLGMFPPVIVNCGRTGLALRCECVEACLMALPPALGLHRSTPNKSSARAAACIAMSCSTSHVDAALWLVERHGYDRFGTLATRRSKSRPPQPSPSLPQSPAQLREFEDGFREAHRTVHMRRPTISAPIGRATCSSPPSANIGKVATVPAACSTNAKTASASAGPITIITPTAPAAPRSRI